MENVEEDEVGGLVVVLRRLGVQRGLICSPRLWNGRWCLMLS